MSLVGKLKNAAKRVAKFKFSVARREAFKETYTKHRKPLTRDEFEVFAKKSDVSSLLHLACENSDIGTIRMLLNADFDIETRDELGETPLFAAVRAFDKTKSRCVC
jgi:hypothetical protein